MKDAIERETFDLGCCINNWHDFPGWLGLSSECVGCTKFALTADFALFLQSLSRYFYKILANLSFSEALFKATQVTCYFIILNRECRFAFQRISSGSFSDKKNFFSLVASFATVQSCLRMSMEVGSVVDPRYLKKATALWQQISTWRKDKTNCPAEFHSNSGMIAAGSSKPL